MHINNFIKQQHHGLFVKKKVVFNPKIYNIYFLVEKFIIHELGASHEWGILALKDNYVHMINTTKELCTVLQDV